MKLAQNRKPWGRNCARITERPAFGLAGSYRHCRRGLTAAAAAATCSLLLYLMALHPAFGQDAPTESPEEAQKDASASSPVDLDSSGLPADCGRDDPFAPLVRKPVAKPAQAKTAGPQESLAAEKKLSPLSLGGIIWSDKRPQAIINGSLVETGDKVGGRTVSRIDPEEVVLEIRGKEEHLRIETPPFVEVTGRQ